MMNRGFFASKDFSLSTKSGPDMSYSLHNIKDGLAVLNYRMLSGFMTKL